MARFSKRSLKNLEGVHPDMVRLMHEAIKNTPIDFTITQGVRTEAEQLALYSLGRTASGMIVTNCDGIRNKSNHQVKSDGYGHAVDLYPYLYGKVNVNAVNELRIIAKHILSIADELAIPIQWGGNWKMRDYPHFEIKKV